MLGNFWMVRIFVAIANNKMELVLRSRRFRILFKGKDGRGIDMEPGGEGTFFLQIQVKFT